MNAPEVRVQYVRVTNNSDQSWSDRHDGVPVTLPPGASQDVPLDMAAHFFGYHPGVTKVAMLRHMAKRCGWNTGDFVKQDQHERLAEEVFSKFLIEPVTFKLVEEPKAQRGAKHAPVPAMTDEEVGDRLHEPTDVKELAKAGLEDPDAEQTTAGRGHHRRDQHGRRKE